MARIGKHPPTPSSALIRIIRGKMHFPQSLTQGSTFANSASDVMNAADSRFTLSRAT